MNHYGNTSSLKDLIFAKGLDTITSSRICSPNKKSLAEKIPGFMHSSFREVILYTSATARSSGQTLNSINAKPQTSANKS